MHDGDTTLQKSPPIAADRFVHHFVYVALIPDVFFIAEQSDAPINVNEPGSVPSVENVGNVGGDAANERISVNGRGSGETFDFYDVSMID